MMLFCALQGIFDEWVSKASSSKLSLELVIYCICLHLYMASDAVVTTPTAPPPYQYAPSLFITHMTRVVEQYGEDSTDQQKPWVELLNKYQQLLADHSQAELLLKLGLGQCKKYHTHDITCLLYHVACSCLADGAKCACMCFPQPYQCMVLPLGGEGGG